MSNYSNRNLRKALPGEAIDNIEFPESVRHLVVPRLEHVPGRGSEVEKSYDITSRDEDDEDDCDYDEDEDEGLA